MKDNYIMLPVFILDRGRKNFKIIGPPCPPEIWCKQGPYEICWKPPDTGGAGEPKAHVA